MLSLSVGSGENGRFLFDVYGVSMPHSRSFAALGLVLVAAAGPVYATNVVMQTVLGDIEIELFDEETPGTVQNFLTYVRDGDYADSLVHRSVPDFVIQGGSFRVEEGLVQDVPLDDPILNEPGIANTRGTIAMAKIADNPDSATAGWFINLVDNPDLDSQNGGFTVFGRVVGDGMEVVDAIAELPRFNLGVPGFTTTPLYNYEPPASVQAENFVTMDIVESTGFTINPGLNDAWYNQETDGQGLFFTVYPDTKLFFLSWFTYETERPAEDVTAILGEPGHRWITAQGGFEGNVATLDATLTTGGEFDSVEPKAEFDLTYGSMTVTFADCDTAVVTYDFPGPGLSGEVTLERVVKDNVPLCEALQEPAEAR